jgi:hypothetical protein
MNRLKYLSSDFSLLYALSKAEKLDPWGNYVGTLIGTRKLEITYYQQPGNPVAQIASIFRQLKLLRYD